tara:strand:+ start:2853 stop:3263 length:411 start_codon:yes stop_codon:yes gene_type:complete
MSKDNGNDGDNKTPNNVIPFPTKPKHISELLPELIEEFTGKLSSEQLRDFEAFIKEKHPLPEDNGWELVDSFTPEELDERMFEAETLVDKTFEYIKYIERNMFKMENSLQIKDLKWLSKNMQKIFIEMQKKVDFKE